MMVKLVKRSRKGGRAAGNGRNEEPRIPFHAHTAPCTRPDLYLALEEELL